MDRDFLNDLFVDFGPVTIRRFTPSATLLVSPTPSVPPADVARTGSTLLSRVPLWAAVSVCAAGILLVAFEFE